MQHNGIGSERNTNRKYRRSNKMLFLLIVYFVVFCAFFDTHAQMPILTPYALSLGAGPFFLGVVIGSYSLFNILGNFAGGLLIDRVSWKLPLFSGLMGVFIILLLYTFADNANHLSLVRAGHGFMGGILVPAALASLVGRGQSSSFQRPRLALFGAAIGLAAVTGPLAAGVIANKYGYHAVYYSLAALMLTAAIAAAVFLTRRRSAAVPGEYPPMLFRQLYDNLKLRGSFIFALGTMGSTGTLAAFLPVKASLLGLNDAQTGMLFATFAMTAIVIQIIWPGFLRGLIKCDCRGCVLGQLLIALALIFAASLEKVSFLFAVLVLFGIGFGLSFQGMLGLVMEGSQPGWRGRAIGIFFAFYSLGAAIVPPLSGLFWQYIPILFPFYTAAAVSLAVLIYGNKTAGNK